MKNKFILIIALLFLLSVLCSCGSSDTHVVNTDNESKPIDAADSPASAVPTAIMTDEPSQSTSYVIEDEIIVDTQYCTFTITNAEEDRIWGPTLKVLCENKTDDKTLMFSVDDVSVNGYMLDPFWSTSVAAGKKDLSKISFSSSSLQENGLTSLDEVDFKLRIYDSDDWMADNLVNQRYTVYPTGLTPDKIETPVRPQGENELLVVDNSDIMFVITRNYDDSIWGYSLSCYLENRSDKDLMFSWDDVSVNGFMLDPFWAKSVSAGKRCISSISFSSSRLEELNVENIELIEFRLKVHDANDWMAENLVDDVFQYIP